MTREFIVVRGRRFTGRRQRALTAHALLLYHHLHCQPDLTPVGTVAINVRRWATAARDLGEPEIDRALVELEAAGLILMDSCTQELLVTCFFEGGPELRNPNHLRSAARSLRCIESEALRAAIYEASPLLLRDAIDKAFASEVDAIAMPSESHVDAKPIYVDVDVDVDVDNLTALKLFRESCESTSSDPDLQSDCKRAAEALILLAERRVAEAPLSWDLERALEALRAERYEQLVGLAGNFPSWTTKNLANAITYGTFDA